MAIDEDYELNAPKLARQKDLDTCWACCLSGLLAANMSARQATENDLVRQYATTPTGGITIPALSTIAKDFGYLFNSFQNSEAAAYTLSDSFFKDRLKLNGMLMIAWRVYDSTKPNDVFFHAQILWGIVYSIKADIGTSRALMHTMNPETAKYELYPLFWTMRGENMPMFTCWPNTRS